jgi:hypothetical protein
LGTSQFKPPNGTLGASSEFDQPLNFYVQHDYSVPMAIRKGCVLPAYLVDAVREGPSP